MIFEKDYIYYKVTVDDGDWSVIGTWGTGYYMFIRKDCTTFNPKNPYMLSNITIRQWKEPCCTWTRLTNKEAKRLFFIERL